MLESHYVSVVFELGFQLLLSNAMTKVNWWGDLFQFSTLRLHSITKRDVMARTQERHEAGGKIWMRSSSEVLFISFLYIICWRYFIWNYLIRCSNVPTDLAHLCNNQQSRKCSTCFWTGQSVEFSQLRFLLSVHDKFSVCQHNLDISNFHKEHYCSIITFLFSFVPKIAY